MIQALQGAPRYLYDQLPDLTECQKNVNSCKTTLVDLTKAHCGEIYTEKNRKIVCMNAFVSFGASLIVGSTVPVAVSAAALAVVASAVYAVAIPLFKTLFADEHGNMSNFTHTFCGIVSATLTLALAPEQGLVYLLPIISLLYAEFQRGTVDVHQMPRIFLF